MSIEVSDAVREKLLAFARAEGLDKMASAEVSAGSVERVMLAKAIALLAERSSGAAVEVARLREGIDVAMWALRGKLPYNEATKQAWMALHATWFGKPIPAEIERPGDSAFREGGA